MSIKVKNITLQQTPETDEALKLLNEAKEKFNLALAFEISASLIFLIISFGCWPQSHISRPLLIISVILIICLLITLANRRIYLKPYYELLRVARLNDKVRHEERIRFRERIRLEEEYKKKKEKTVEIKAVDIVKQTENKNIAELPVDTTPIMQRPILHQNKNIVPIKKDIQNN